MRLGSKNPFLERHDSVGLAVTGAGMVQATREKNGVILIRGVVRGEAPGPETPPMDRKAAIEAVRLLLGALEAGEKAVWDREPE
jgi:hypothetical protein